MIPTNLKEAIEDLDSIIDKDTRAFLTDFKKNKDSLAIQLHNSLGRHLRNRWCLWGGSDLSKYLHDEHKVTHPDEMSHFVIVEYIRHQIPNRFQRILREP
jgi:hypothetical protein